MNQAQLFTEPATTEDFSAVHERPVVKESLISQVPTHYLDRECIRGSLDPTVVYLPEAGVRNG